MSTIVESRAREEESAMRRSVLGGAVGSFVEYYEFSVYAGIATILAVVFFPAADQTTGLLSALAVFAIAFFARPLGGGLWGLVGDRIGRKRALLMTVLLMSGATAGMGLLPGYSTIGILAPILLVLLRFVQGVCAGGEVSSAVSFIAEHSDVRRRGFNVAMVSIGAVTGTFFGSIVTGTLVLTLSDDAMQSWGWRVPLLLAIPLGLVCTYIRRRLAETPHFVAMKGFEALADTAVDTDAVAPTWSRAQKIRTLVLALGIIGANASSFYLLVGYIPSFASKALNLRGYQAFIPSVVGLGVCLVIQVTMARLSDRIGRKPILLANGVGLLVFSFPAFLLMNSGSYPLILLGVALFGFFVGGYGSVINTVLAELFPTRIRVTGHGLCYNLAVAVFGGSAPYFLTWIGGETGSNLVGAVYVMVLAVVALFAVSKMEDQHGRPLL